MIRRNALETNLVKGRSLQCVEHARPQNPVRGITIERDHAAFDIPNLRLDRFDSFGIVFDLFETRLFVLIFSAARLDLHMRHQRPQQREDDIRAAED